MKYILTRDEVRLDGRYFRKLDLILDDLFQVATEEFGYSWAQIAAHAGLCATTIYNLGNRRTKRPQYRTVDRIAHAMGREIELVPSKVEQVTKRTEKVIHRFTNKKVRIA